MQFHKSSLRRCTVLAAAAVCAGAPAARAAVILGHTNQDGPLLHTNQDHDVTSISEAPVQGGADRPPWMEPLRLPGGVQLEVLGAAPPWVPAPAGGVVAFGPRAAPLPHGNSPALPWSGTGAAPPVPGPGGMVVIGLGAMLAGRRGRRRER